MKDGDDDDNDSDYSGLSVVKMVLVRELCIHNSTIFVICDTNSYFGDEVINEFCMGYQ